MVDLAKLDVAAALNLSVEQRAQLELLEAAWMPLNDLKELVEQRDALMAERTNLIETKRQQLSAAESRATAAEGRVALLEEERDEARKKLDDIDLCPVCLDALKAEDWCLTDIELGTCHAACLEGVPMVDLDSGEPLPEGATPPKPFRYNEALDAAETRIAELENMLAEHGAASSTGGEVDG